MLVIIRLGGPSFMRSALIACLATCLTAVHAQAAPTGPAPVPADFLWGVSTSGFQSEGSAPDSNWRRYAAQQGNEPYQNAIDFRHRYAEDIQRAAALGVKVFRFSVEWARVQPAPDRWDETELAYYDDVLRKIKAAGMRPMITLDHWVYPGWIADRHGWSDPGTVTAWLANARKVIQRYRGQGALWITINEPTVYLAQEVEHTKADKSVVADHLVQAHRGAYDLVHELDPGALVSSNVAFIVGVNEMVDKDFLDRVADKLDYVGLDYYYGLSVDNTSILGADLVHAPWKVDPQPDGIYYALRQYARRFPKLPLYVVENGMAGPDGSARPDGYTRAQHLRDHVYWVQRAIADGMHVIGYNYWSLTDNYEWGSYKPRFGLYTVDSGADGTLSRRPTDAVTAYREITARHGVPAGYRPAHRDSTCSLVDGLTSCLRPHG
ncbi:beta-glucosidase [Kutzneria viridogrisea]|uniref:Beta-glucosidase n=1 Tax=Kutzneria viridogrisea TaxID=47990 RepID=A0ABR6BMU6_9PSEU|nr:beta-glucosidase [Kutzneria viridogrisea]